MHEEMRFYCLACTFFLFEFFSANIHLAQSFLWERALACQPKLPAVLGASVLDTLDTPALVVDLDLFDSNIERITTACREANVGWRPHCKPHKSGELARLLIERGALGVTCAKLSEAVVMADAGIQDILIANQITAPAKIERLVALRSRVDVAVCVDNVDNARVLSDAALRAGCRLRVLIEVDTGTRRAGVLPGEPVVELARSLVELPGLDFAGVMTWEGHTTQIVPPEAKEAAIRDALGLLTESADRCRSAGMPVRIVSCSGTGTYQTACRLPGVTEIEAGGGIFGDVRYSTRYHVDLDYALVILATVTSRPTSRRIVVDAGKKALSTDAGTPLPILLSQVESVSFSAEHGKIELSTPSDTPRVGERIALVPGYADTTIHLHRCIYGVRGNRIEAVWPLREDSRLL
ncbi:DSD1 family PLP-dependent enzyme [Noviherbaspirillum malthae]|uniref:DSD1 family PLP-dependent enzyme n=1 Tax=Noviherbaspirillum malthae TaxID=1260987 RepID=UPI00188F4630|nr:DSD1 family PLP-dependent enzyme [Noviherbaspirillum malthae]